MYEGFCFFETRGDRSFLGLPVGINRGYGKSFKALYDWLFELFPEIGCNNCNSDSSCSIDWNNVDVGSVLYLHFSHAPSCLLSPFFISARYLTVVSLIFFKDF